MKFEILKISEMIHNVMCTEVKITITFKLQMVVFEEE